ncbi:unnamed protein product [Periconia digitata]|uniref:Uncharacterized protein n=1 Tax=Periconia digitata TaxID=1303443 RepID=A0A9W4XLK8_9PLEO|nr:unnamed protein product [Periconia digitata]
MGDDYEIATTQSTQPVNGRPSGSITKTRNQDASKLKILSYIQSTSSDYQRKSQTSKLQMDRADLCTAKHKVTKNKRKITGKPRLKLKLRAPPPAEEYEEPLLSTTEVLYGKLEQASEIQTELPHTVNGEDDNTDAVLPWTAKQLSDLYLFCQKNNSINLCDMIADTWIRAFHTSNLSADRDGGNNEERPWLKKAFVGPSPPGEQLPQSYLNLQLKLDASVTLIYHNVHDKEDSAELEDSSDTLLETANDIYNHTSPNSPVRLLWADILALHGRRLEHILNPSSLWSGDPEQVISGNRTQHQLHRDLEFDIMCTALRLVRRKLTLKCEETTVGAWCKRYHLHTQHGLKCYRQLAREVTEVIDVNDDEYRPR